MVCSKLTSHPLFLLFLLFVLAGCRPENEENERPNIVYILIDDLGYGDLGCYGSTQNETPNIDRLAAEGILFTDFHSNGPMCTPTRAALMTGQYQHRLGRMFEGPLNGKTQRDKGLPLEVTTVAEVLKEAGYATGAYGKWHLGYAPPFLPTSHGFDDFRGLGSGDGDHHTHINRWGYEDWWHNNEIDMEEGYSVDLITKHSVDFMRRHKDAPFFLYVSHLAIHFPWQGPDDPPHRVKGMTYGEDKWGIIEDPDDVSPHVKSMVESVDGSVGKILSAIRDLDLGPRTLVVFASDNGGYIHYSHQFHNISSNGPLRGQKAQVYEGGHRVPCIAWWPGKIPAGGVTDQIVMTMDMFPTFARIAGAHVPAGHSPDGMDIRPVLFDNVQLGERTVFWKIDEDRAVRRGPWKLCMVEGQAPELFHLGEDLGEQNDLSAERLEIVQQLKNVYTSWEQDVTSGYQTAN